MYMLSKKSKSELKNEVKNHKFSKEEVELSIAQFGKTPNELMEMVDSSNMEEVSTKPLSKIWFEVSDKIKFSNPKKTEKHFRYICNELYEVYGKEVGNIVGNMLFDVIEDKFYRLNNGKFIPFNRIISMCSQNKWKKVINEVNLHMKSEHQFFIG